MQSRISHASARRTKSRRSDFQLAKSNQPKALPAPRKPGAVKKTGPAKKKSLTQGSGQPAGKTGKKSSGLSNLLTPEHIQDSLKSVGTLRKSLKSWLNYLQQADQMLETIYVTSNSLKETGVLDKLIKQRGKNLTTDDFTNILIALMNSPVGSQVLKGSGGDSSAETPAQGS